MSLRNIMRAQPREFEIAPGTWKKPDNGKVWIITAGHISHVTGTTSYFHVEKSGSMFLRTSIDTGIASMDVALFSNDASTRAATTTQALWTPLIVTDQFKGLYFNGAATAKCVIQVLEWDA